MGCDIHAWIEYKNKTGEWFDFANPYLVRDYAMFGLMAKARCEYNESFEARGIPEDVSYGALGRYTLFVIEDEKNKNTGEIWQKEVRGYLGCGAKFVSAKRISNPDWHHASWLTVDEFEYCINKHRELCDWEHVNYQATLSAMKEFKKADKDCRLVFWFDN